MIMTSFVKLHYWSWLHEDRMALPNGQFVLRLTFDLDNKNEIPGNVVKFLNLVEKCCNVWKI